MFRTLRNIIINFMAIFILDRDARHKFRKKYKKKSNFRKLRDDNIELLNKNKYLETRLNAVQNDITFLKKVLLNHTWLNLLDTNPDIYLSVACIAKDEAKYLKEWIEYHKIVGVERFYFYDNESTDNTREVLEPYIKNGTVIYRYVEGKAMQSPVFQDAVLKARGHTRWLALIDLDEFILPIEKDSVSEFLKDYEQYPGVAINWVCFDDNGHKTKPTAHGGLVTANYTRVVVDHNSFILDKSVKCIVNPNDVIFLNTPHFCIYKNDFAVTENFEEFSSIPTKYHSSNKIRINHYYRKSAEEFQEKTRKGDANLRAFATRRVYKKIWDSSSFPEEIKTTHDFAIQKYIPQLKSILGITE